MATKKMVIKLSFIMLIMFSVTIAFAQPNGGGGGQGGGGTPPDGTGGPIDGGAIVLLAGIAGYAHRKLKAQYELNK